MKFNLIARLTAVAVSPLTSLALWDRQARQKQIYGEQQILAGSPTWAIQATLRPYSVLSYVQRERGPVCRRLFLPNASRAHKHISRAPSGGWKTRLFSHASSWRSRSVAHLASPKHAIRCSSFNEFFTLYSFCDPRN